MNSNAMIGLKIAALRKQHGLTQEQLAEKLEISIKHCSSVERGLSCLSLEKLVEVSNLFDVSLDYLLKEKNDSHNSYDYLSSKLPPSIINILHSENDHEINLLKDYLCMYNKIRGHKF